MVLRADELKMLYAAASVNDPPNPTMDWYVVFGLTVMTEPLPAVPKVTADFWVSLLAWSAVVSQTLADVAANDGAASVMT